MGRKKETFRLHKNQSELINLRILELIRDNKSFREIAIIFNEEVSKWGRKYSESAIHKRYIAVVDMIKSDTMNEVLEDIRASRIESLRKDIQTAYNHYLEDKNKASSREWFRVYIDLKNNLDKFYPNGLQPDKVAKDLSIQIEFKDA